MTILCKCSSAPGVGLGQRLGLGLKGLEGSTERIIDHEDGDSGEDKWDGGAITRCTTREDVVRAVDSQVLDALNPMMKWVLDRTRVGDDRRFLAHGTGRCTTGYAKFTAAKEAAAVEREKESAAETQARSAGRTNNIISDNNRVNSSNNKVDRNRSRGGGVGLALPLFRVVSYYDTRSYDCRDIPSQSPGSLMLLFQYYCKLLTPSGVNTGLNKGSGLTYDLIQVANDTMSLTELMIFATDFHLVPAIISNAGVHFCWQRQRVGRHVDDNSPTELDYRAFVEVLVRIALIAFSHLRDPKDRVYELANYLALSESDQYAKTIEGLEISRRGNTRATKGLAERAAIHSEENEDEEDSGSDSDEKGRGGTEKSIRRRTRPPKPWRQHQLPVAVTRAKEELEAKTHMAGSDQRRRSTTVKTITTTRTSSSRGQINFYLVDNSRKRWSKIDVTRGYYNDKKRSSDANSKAVAAAAATTVTSNKGTKKKDNKGSHKSTADVNRQRKKFWDADSQFDKDMLDIYSPYEFENGRVEFLPFDGEFIDMGVLVHGSQHNFRVIVQNVSRNSLQMDVELSSNLRGVTAKFDAQQIPMGMQRIIDVFVKGVGVGELVGDIKIIMYDKDAVKLESRRVPVYLHVVEPAGAQAVSKTVIVGLDRAVVADTELDLTPGGGGEEQDNVADHPITCTSWACASPKFLVASPSALAQKTSRAALSFTPKEVSQQGTGSNIISGLSLPSPTRRIQSAREVSLDVGFQRLPLPVSLMPQRQGHQSLVTKRASFQR